MQNTPESTDINFTNTAFLKPQPIEWLWPNHIPLGHLTLIAGDPGVGKSTLVTDIAARTSSGHSWPKVSPTFPSPITNQLPIIPAQVIYLSPQEHLSATLLPRLTASGADLTRIIAASATPEITDCLDQLDAMLSHLDYCRLVVFDPLSAYFRQHESSRTQETREVFDTLTEIAARQEVAIIGTTQQSRSQRGPDVSRLSTSVKLAATARAIWTIKTDSTTPGRRLLKPTKNNLAPDTNYLAFTIQPAASNREVGHIVWEDAEATADAATSRQTRLAKSSDAGRWLLIKLANGPVTSRQLKQDGNIGGDGRFPDARVAGDESEMAERDAAGPEPFDGRGGEGSDVCEVGIDWVV